MSHEELIAALIDYKQCDEEGIYCITSRQAVEEAAAALRDLIAMRTADFEVYHEMFMALFHAAPNKYRSGVEMAQDIIAQRDDLQRQLGDYETLKRAVNESTNECGPDCDDHGHGDQCPANNSAQWLIDQQKEIEQLRARLASFEEDERDMDPVFHCGCIFDPESKDGNAPPTSECLYHERLRKQLGEANEALMTERAEAQARLEAAERALTQIMDVGHDDDCILSGFKDRRVDMYFNAARGEPT